MAAFFNNLREVARGVADNWTTGLAQTTSSAAGSTLTESHIGDYIANTQASFYSPPAGTIWDNTAFIGGSDYGLGQVPTTATEVASLHRSTTPRFDRILREARRQAGQAEEMNVPREVWELMRDSNTLRTHEGGDNYSLSQHGRILWRYDGHHWTEAMEKRMDDDWSPADKAYTIALFMAERGWFKWNRGPIEFARLVNQLHAEYSDAE